MAKFLQHIAFAGMTLLACSSMSAQAVYRLERGTGAAKTMDKPRTTNQFLAKQQVINNLTAAKPSFATRSEAQSMEWGYCDEPYTCLPIDGDIKVAVRMTEDITTKFAGNSITAIELANPVDAGTIIANMYYANPVKEATVWISKTRNGEPIASGTGSLGDYGFNWSTISLDEPFELTAGENLYIGVSLSVPEGMYGYVADAYYPENDYSAYLYSAYNISNQQLVKEETSTWRSVGDWIGNACVRAVISGDNLPQNNVSIDSYSLPTVVSPGDEIPVQLGIINTAANDVSKVTVTMQIGDAAPQSQECEIAIAYDENYNYIMGPLAYNQFGIVETSFTCDQIGNNIPWTIKISKLNGDADNNSEQVIEGSLLSIKEGFAKTNVLEEATGTWCGYCVVGYAGMEWLRENAPNFIGIGVHGDDQMDVLGENGAYFPFSGFISGFPSSFLNRNWGTDIYPSPEYLYEAVETYGSLPAMAEIEAKIENLDETGSKIRLSTTRRFSLAESDVDYAVGYTVIEDEVGPYMQTNYLSGAGYDAYGFEDMPNPVSLVYNEVARNCSHPTAVSGSSITTTELDKNYEFSTEIDLKGVTNLAKYRVVAYVLNCKNGAIENACEVVSPAFSGVEKVESESKLSPIAYGGKGCITILSASENVSVLALDGRKAAGKVSNGKVSVAPGIYIVTDGKRSAKVTVR